MIGLFAFIAASVVATRAGKGPFHKPILMNGRLLSSGFITFDLNPTCHNLAYVKLSYYPEPSVDTSTLGVEDTQVSVLDYGTFIEKTVKSRMVCGTAIHTFSTNIKAGRCSITVKRSRPSHPMFIEVFGF